MQGGDGVEVGDEIKGFTLMLQFHGWAHHAEVVADMQCAGGLYAGKDSFHAGGRLHEPRR